MLISLIMVTYAPKVSKQVTASQLAKLGFLKKSGKLTKPIRGKFLLYIFFHKVFSGIANDKTVAYVNESGIF